MANLSKKSEDRRRLITWRGKSLMNCSKDELMDFIVYLNSQMQAVIRASEMVAPPKPVSNPVIDSTISEKANDQTNQTPAPETIADSKAG